MQDYIERMGKMDRREILVKISEKCKDMNILDNLTINGEVKEVLVKERKEKRKKLDKLCYNLDVEREMRLKTICWDCDRLERKALEWRHFLVR